MEACGIAIPALPTATDVDQLADLDGAENGKLCVAVVCQSFKKASRTIWDTEKPPATLSAKSNLFTRLLRFVRFSREPYGGACLVLYQRLPGEVAAFPLDSPVFRLRQDVLHEKGDEVREASKAKRPLSWGIPLRGFEALLNLERRVVPDMSTLIQIMTADKNFVRGGKVLPAEVVRCGTSSDKQREFLIVPRMLGIVVVSRPVPCLPRGRIAAPSACGGRPTALVARLESEGTTERCRFVFEHCDVRVVDGKVYFPVHKCRTPQTQTAKYVSLPTTYSMLLGEARSVRGPSSGFSPSRPRWLRLQHRRIHPGSTRIVPAFEEDILREEEKSFCGLETGVFDVQDRRQGSGSGGCEERRRDQHVDTGVEPRRPTVGDAKPLPITAVTPHFVQELLAEACKGEIEQLNDMHEEARSVPRCVQARNAACALLARELKELPEKSGEEGRKPDTTHGTRRAVMIDQWYEALWNVLVSRGGDAKPFQPAARSLLEGLLAIPGVKLDFLQRGLLRRLTNNLRDSLARARNRGCACNFCNGHEEFRDSVGCSQATFHPGNAKPSGEGVTECVKTTTEFELRPRGVDLSSVEYSTPSQGLNDTPWWLLRCEMEGVEEAKALNNSHSTSTREDDLEVGGSTDVEAGCELALGVCLVPVGGKDAPLTSRDGVPVKPGRDPTGKPVEDSSVMIISSAGAEESKWRGRGKDEAGGEEGIILRERIAPPMLRLDVLDHIFGKKDHTSPRYSSRVTAALSTASTRAPPHLSTRSARGATSRASAGHDSGRSVRTGSATQRDSVSLGWPTERSFCSLVHTIDQDPPPRKSSPPTQDRAGDSSAGALPPKSCRECQHGDTLVVEQELPGFVGSRCVVDSRAYDKADSNDPSTGFPREYSPWVPIAMTRPGVHPAYSIIDAAERKHGANSTQQRASSAVREAIEASEVNASVVVHGSYGKPLNNSSDSPYETGMCRTVGFFDNISAALVLKITYATASPILLSLPPQQQTSRRNQGDVWTNLIADAKLVLTLLLPSAVPAQDVEEALRVALETLSTSIWSRHDAVLDTPEPLTSKGNARVVQDGTTSRSAPEAQGWQGLAPVPREFDSIDIVTLSNAIESAFDYRQLRLRAHCKADGDYAYGETASVCHRRWVHGACALCLESAWLVALLHKQVDSLISKADIRYMSLLPAEAVECALSFCGRALESVRKSCFYSSFWLYSGEDTSRDQINRMGVTASDCRNAGAFFLGAPVLFNLSATFITLLRRPRVWGEELMWSGQTLRSIAHDNDTPPVSTLVVLFDLLVTSIQEGGAVMGAASNPFKQTCIGDDTTRGLTKGLSWDTHALDELLGSIVQSLVAVLHRSNTLMETHRDIAWSKSRSTPTVVSRVAEPSPTGVNDKKTRGCDLRSRRTRDAVVEDSIRIVREKIAPAFRPKGSVHALLQDDGFMRFQVNSAMNGQNETRSAVSSHGYFPRVKISTSVLAATLRLGCLFFALQAKTRDEDVGAGNKEGQGTLGVFTAQVISAFCGRYKEIYIGSDASFGVQACTRQQISGETNGVEHEGKGSTILRQERSSNVILCGLHLELLARLAALRDLSVQEHIREMQLPEFLVRYLVGGRTTKEEPGGLHSTTENSAQRLGDAETAGSKMRLGAEIRRPQNGATSTRGADGRLQAYNEWKEEECLAETIVGKEEAHDSAAQRSSSCRSPNNATCAITPVPDRGKLAARICGDRNGSQDPVLPARIRGKSQAAFAPGDRIDGLIAFRDKRSRWFPGHVARTNEDGSLYICYDDGDENPAKASGEVRHGQKRNERDRKPCIAGHPGSRVAAAAAAIGAINNLESLKVKKSAAPAATPRTMDYAGHVRYYAMSLVHGATTSALASSAVRGLEDSADAHNEAGSSIVDEEVSDHDEDNDTYFVIPSVVKARVTIPVSWTPRIDLLSSTFCSRKRSSQLGPGSSLSAPTTGGSDEDALQKRSGSRSGVLVSRRFPNGPTEKCSRTSMDGSPSASSSDGSSRALPVPMSTSAPTALMLKEQFPLTAPREGPNSAPVRLLRGEDEREEREDDNINPREYFVIDLEENSHAKRRRAGKSGIDATEAQTLTEGVGACPFHQSENELRGMQACAISLLLSLSSTPNSYGLQGERGRSGPNYSPTSLCPGGSFLADTMTRLTLCLDDPKNADVIMNLNTRWCGNSMLEASPAVLTKLVCAALFDSESYSIDGQRIASGAFGDIVVSRSPLPMKPVAALPRHCGKADEVEASASRKKCSLLTQTSTRPAEECSHGDEVALKIVERDEVDGTIGPSVFYEVLALRTLSDVSGVCRLYDFGVTPTAYVLVMERCPLSVRDWRAARSGINYGGKNCARESGELSPGPGTDKDIALYLLVFRQVVAAVAAISERGVIHLDLKCDNVLVRKKLCDISLALPQGFERVGDFAEVPCVCLADFGQSIIGRRCKTSSCRTDVSPRAHPFEFDVCGSRGTERIQSPEMIVLTDGIGGWRNLEVSTDTDQDRSLLGAHGRGEVVRNCNRISTASDVWSLGCLLYELLTGRLLFEDMQWSEFFVTLTGVGTTIEEESTAARAVTARSPAPPVLTAAALLPFSQLGSAKVIEELLKYILVRNAVKRPRASQVIRNIDKALGIVVAWIRAPLVTKDVRDIDPAHPTTRQSKDFIFTAQGTTGSTVRPAGNRSAGKECMPAKANSCGVQPGIRNTSLVWPLRPCAAVDTQQQLSERLSATFNCAGCFYRLGAGAFLLELNSLITFSRTAGTMPTSECNRGVIVTDVGKRSTSQVTPDESACPCPTCISSETPVVCLTSRADWIFKAEGYGANTESVSSSLGNILSTLGITHVACVTSTDGSQDWLGDQKSRNGCCEPSPSRCRCMLGGCQLLNVQLPSKATGGEQKGSGLSLIELSFAQCVDDVLKFAIGPRALFVSAKGERGAAGALAMAWAIHRTGMGIFETMLDFRQSCPGFWVEPDVIQSIFGL